MDYRKMYDDKEHLYAYDLDGERTLEIASVSRGELTGDKNRKTKKPMVTFVGEPKKLALNKTNGKTIAKLYGRDTDHWAGELITIYPTTTDFGGETVDCIRVKPDRPQRGESRRSTPAAERKSGGGSRQSRAAQSASQASAIDAMYLTSQASEVAAMYLIGQYEKCDGSEGLGEARMAELKIDRGRHWSTFTDADREAVGAAAKAAKERIDAVAAGSPALHGDPPSTDAAEAARGE